MLPGEVVDDVRISFRNMGFLFRISLYLQSCLMPINS